MTVPAATPPGIDDEQGRRVDVMIDRQNNVMAFARNVLVVVVAVAVLGSLAIAAVFGRLGGIQDAQAAGRIRTYQTRSVNCVALLLASTMRLPGDCTDPEVLPYVCRTASQTGMAGWVERVEEQTGTPCRFPSS